MSLKNLSTYRKKRDFDKTTEPSGDVPVEPSRQRRFVIQKHDATRLHYDFRLEFDGVFKSWAVTRGPSLDPHDKRLAVEVEDHPLDYGDFEGTIPQGQYGGGTVQLWDRGTWESDDPDERFKKGDLKFILHGDKLQGGWVLVRMRHDRSGGKRTNWLLIKHRDDYAREGEDNDILEEDRSVASGRTMAEIEAGKGNAPRPFMTKAAGRGKADAVWHSNRGEAAEARAHAKNAAPPKKTTKVNKMPEFVEPLELCHAGRSARRTVTAGARDQIRRLSRADAGRERQRHFKNAQGPRLDRQVQGDCQSGHSAARCMIDGEVVALDHDGQSGFLRASGRDFGRQNGSPDLLRFRSSFR